MAARSARPPEPAHPARRRTLGGFQVFATPAVWRIHRAIGMGGDRIVTEIAGDDVEARHGDDLRARPS